MKSQIPLLFLDQNKEGRRGGEEEEDCLRRRPPSRCIFPLFSLPHLDKEQEERMHGPYNHSVVVDLQEDAQVDIVGVRRRRRFFHASS